MNKKLRNFLITTGAICTTAACTYGLNVLDAYLDKKKYLYSGKMVDVRGRKMHIYSAGSGERTLVFLTGQGTPTPSLDFQPLISKLNTSYRCVVPEPFGYGYSDSISEPRTVQNVVGELREGLRKAGFLPPYVLVGHSVAGLLTTYWAAHYPREISAVVGLDTSLPEQGDYYSYGAFVKALLRCAPTVKRFSPARLIAKMGWLDKKLSAFTGGNAEYMPIVRSHAANMMLSPVTIDELVRIGENCSSVGGINYPVSCPVLMLVSSESCDLVKENHRIGLDWLAEHEKIAMHSHSGKCLLLVGSHYLHQSAASAVAAEILAFVPTSADSDSNASLWRILGKK